MGKSKVRLNLLEDTDDCTDEELEADWQQPPIDEVQPAENGANSEAALVGINNSQPLSLQQPEVNQLEPVLTAQEENELSQENDLLELYSGQDEDTSGVIINSQGSTDGD